MNKIGYTVKALSVLGLAVLIIVFSHETSQSVTKSIDVCIGSVIPSMFALMVLSSYIISSGLYRVLLSPLLFLFRRIIKTDDRTLSVFLLSLFGGYPVGLKLLSEINAHNNNYHEISKKAAMFCYCISPTFAAVMLGNGVFGSTEAGLIIYASNALACFIMAVVISNTGTMTADISISDKNYTFFSAINSTVRSLSVICSVLICFNIAITCVNCVLHSFGSELAPQAAGLIEITNLLDIRSVSVSDIPFVSAAASFGGVCVIAQCSAIAKDKLDLTYFYPARIACSVLSGIIAKCLTYCFDISVQTSSSAHELSYEFNTNKAAVILMMIMCGIVFLRSEEILNKKHIFKKRINRI